MRKFAVLAAATTVACLGAPAAGASPPTHEPVSFADRTFSGVCAFSVFRHVLDNNSVLTTFSDGSQLTTGTFKERLTNVSNDHFVDVNASGPILTVFHPDGSSTETLRGPQFVRPPGQLLITTGRVTIERNPSGAIVGFSQQGGTSTDVCALLA